MLSSFGTPGLLTCKILSGLVLQAEEVQSGEIYAAEDIEKVSALKRLSLRLEPKFFLATSRAIHTKNKRHPFRRLRWAVIDKAKLEDLLKDVRQVIGCLW